MPWVVDFHDEFAAEFRAWRHDVQRAAATSIAALQLLGPMLGRPHVDTLKASGHGNMKELRLSVGDGEWRIAFAFDPRRHAILLVGASKSGVTSDRFYRRLIAVADARLDAHLVELRKGRRR
ncbi:MAG: type II toxin-antitoxin system RelE/ParE family toxin [Alphaproteobacteria bacterium]|nr:type II toxin-antitoxin system RelE/ParE family toxin [Alphaproteobacteria bacterium]